MKERENLMLAGLKRINKTLLEMQIGILIYATIGQVIIGIVPGEFLFMSLGWWIGIILSLMTAYHMWWSLDRALRFGQRAAVKVAVTHNILRYLFVVIVMVIVMVLQIGDPLMGVIALFSLKAGAYLQPLVHRILNKTNK